MGTDSRVPHSVRFGWRSSPSCGSAWHGVDRLCGPNERRGRGKRDTSSRQTSRKKHAVIDSRLAVQGFLSLWGNPRASALSRST